MQQQPPPPPPSPLDRNSKKRPPPSPLMDADVVEIPPPEPPLPKPHKHKQTAVPEVIDIVDDDVEDSAGNADLEKELNKIKKGKAVMDVSDGHLNGFHEESFADHIYIPDDFDGAADGPKVNGSEEVSFNSINADAAFYDLTSCDDDYMDYIFDDGMQVHEDYDLLQAHFDSMDIPPGVEAPIPFLLPSISNNAMSTSGNGNHSLGSLHSGTAGISVNTESPGWSGASPFGTNTVTGSYGTNTTWLPTDSTHDVQSIKNQAGSQRKGSGRSFSFGLESINKSRRLLESLKNKKSPFSSSNYTSSTSSSQFAGTKHSYGVDPYSLDQSMAQDAYNPIMLVNSSYQSFKQTLSGSSSYPNSVQKSVMQKQVSPPYKTLLTEASKHLPLQKYAPHSAYSSYIQPFAPSVYTLPEEDTSNEQTHSSSGGSANDTEGFLQRFENFKQFDIVIDHSDHHYTGKGSSSKQPTKSWAKRIQEEWKSLEKDLPESIFVRVYETRMDLLRAVIVGAEGTPYHDGLYFFDVLFPPNYPHCPPQVYYQSRGLRLNPNLYNSGKVCLSLLNTWSGDKNEKWMPGVSTTLQVLVSIQGLILNTKPYFNEPGYANMQGSASGEMQSLRYNEDTFILSLRTMTCVVRTPPKHFEDFVKGHFFKRSEDILMACKAYLEGTQVGSYVRGSGRQDGGAEMNGSFTHFKNTVLGYIQLLAKEFIKLGAKGCERFLALPSAPTETKRQVGAPSAPKETKRQVGGVTIIERVE